MSPKLITRRCSLAPACAMLVALALPGEPAAAATLNLVERSSSAQNRLFAGSGDSIDRRDESDSITARTGSFSFADSGEVSVAPGTGAAEASGSITFSDDVSMPDAQTIIVTGSAEATGDAKHLGGTGNANSRQEVETFIEFMPLGVDATYTLNGTYTPPDDGGVIEFQLTRKASANKRFDIETAGQLNEVGTIPAGQTWIFQVRVNDTDSANANNDFDTDSFSFDYTFTVTSIPEPASAAILTALTPLLCRRSSR